MSAPGFPTPPLPGYSMPPPPPPPGYAYGYRYASLPARFGAILLDFFVLLAITAVIAIPFGLIALASFAGGTPVGWLLAFVWGPFALLMFVLWIGYFTFFEGTTGQTPGKRVLGIRVVALATGRPPDLTHAFARSVLRIIDWLPTLFLLGLVAALVTPHKQRLGDLVANTVVVRV
jgi:uncharacterized RDD family membrane protein YckC